MRIHNVAFLLLILGLFLSACGQLQSSVSVSPLPLRPTHTASPPKVRPLPPASTHNPASTRRPSPSPTPSSTTTVTPSSTTTATPTPSPTPSVTRTATATYTFTPNPSVPTLFPMSIAAMRHGSYPGSDIVVDEELGAGANYRRYYVYYLSEGFKIYALLTIPEGNPPVDGWPGIVFNHGYIPPNEYRTTEKYEGYVDRLARSGYIIFRIDYRGHGHSEGTPQGAYGDPGYEVDVLNAVASLKRHPQVNPKKIGMWGHSMGGYLTLRTMVISDNVKVGVIWAGVVADYPDLLYNWPEGPGPVPTPGDSRKWMRDWPTQFGTPDENPTFWDSISANSYLADLSGPLQLHYGTDDADVPPQFSETLADQVRAAGRDVEIYAYQDDNHNLTNYFNLAMDRTIEFFDSILK